jgi:hypothetical protein
MRSALRPPIGPGGLPLKPEIDPGDVTEVTDAANDWLDWWDARFPAAPGGGVNAWRGDRLSYEFAVGAPDGRGGEIVLTATGYPGGRLDWHAFEGGGVGTLGADQDDAATTLDVSAMPTPVGFPGMPAPRWWELEDGDVDLGAFEVAPDDLGRLLLMEFALAYGNDFFQLPLVLPTGSLCRIDDLTVTNTFGQAVSVPQAAAADGASPTARWRMFDLDPGLLLVPPTLVTVLDGPTLEEVLIGRDEMANLAWAVERRVQGPAGLPVDRHEIEVTAAAEAPPPAAETLRYRLATPLPAHWLPLVPTRVGGAAGGRDARLLLGGPQPAHGELLRPPGGGQLAVNEEEVPREGLLLVRRARRGRSADGSVHVWVGRDRRPGAGEATIALRFDQVSEFGQ